MDQLRVLFLGRENASRGPMAEGLLRSLGGDGVAVVSAGVTSGELHPAAVAAMAGIGIDISQHRSGSIADLEQGSFDMVITLGDQARECALLSDGEQTSEEDTRSRRAVLQGAPCHLHWPIADPADGAGPDAIREAFEAARDDLRQRIEVAVEHGYLRSIALERGRLNQLFDGLQDGLMVHDDHRIIYAFNRAAEQITGYSRDEMIGRDCHEVFGGEGLCGAQCDFLQGDPGEFPRHERTVKLPTRSGEERSVRMTINHVETGADRRAQVLATFRDITELDALRRATRTAASLHGMVAVSAAMREIFETVRQVSASDYPTLILGDSGTGKELIANAVHNESRRKGGPFVPINCGALPENILESELFGHVRGAFTGAIRDKKGRFELADGGTLFLDEIGELSQAFQVRLLRVLQEKRFEKVGGETSIQVDVRIISATNRDLRQMVADGEFREDLFYRLCVVPISLPPLRDRREDIPLIVEQVLGQIRAESGKDIRSVSDRAMQLLMGHRWPGNVRELINSLQFASVRCNGTEIEAHHLSPDLLLQQGERLPMPGDLASGQVAAPASPRRRRKLTLEAVRAALNEAGGNKVKAARLLGVGRATLYRFLSDHPVS